MMIEHPMNSYGFHRFGWCRISTATNSLIENYNIVAVFRGCPGDRGEASAALTPAEFVMALRLLSPRALHASSCDGLLAAMATRATGAK